MQLRLRMCFGFANSTVLALPPPSRAAESDCTVQAVEQGATAYEGIAASPKSDQLVITRPDARGIYQVYAGPVGAGEPTTCISCSERPDSPSADGTPGFGNKRDITPAGARWVEPGNFHPDGHRLLISADVGMEDAEGQDQLILDVETGQLQNLTRSPEVWDEHGLLSPDGSKITFMSSYPYRSKKGSNKVGSLKTEFMVMNVDGTGLKQVTHFNEPGHPESLPKDTVAAVAPFVGDGSRLFANVMAPAYSLGKTNWVVMFRRRPRSRHRRSRMNGGALPLIRAPPGRQSLGRRRSQHVRAQVEHKLAICDT